METGSIKNALLGLLPRSVQQFLKRIYYPYVIRAVTERDWPYALVARQLVKPGDCVVDAGANVGYTSALMARWVGGEGAVYSFEPVPETFELLRHNM
ncbi:MAG: FkbM family methyltransferase, partial [Candidatus Binatia bacterium]